jgi:Sulfotransferase domain
MAKFRAMAIETWRTRVGVTDVFDRDAMIFAYRRHNDAVRAEAPRDRLLEWRAGEGWEPLAGALGVPVPETPFPHVNAREQFAPPAFGTAKEWTA